MLRRVPSKEDIDKVIEVYHQHPIKGINLEMLKEARQRTCLGLSEIKKIIADYIENTYGTTLHKIKKEELICDGMFEKSEVRLLIMATFYAVSLILRYLVRNTIGMCHIS